MLSVCCLYIICILSVYYLYVIYILSMHRLLLLVFRLHAGAFLLPVLHRGDISPALCYTQTPSYFLCCIVLSLLRTSCVSVVIFLKHVIELAMDPAIFHVVVLIISLMK